MTSVAHDSFTHYGHLRQHTRESHLGQRDDYTRFSKLQKLFIEESAVANASEACIKRLILCPTDLSSQLMITVCVIQ